MLIKVECVKDLKERVLRSPGFVRSEPLMLGGPYEKDFCCSMIVEGDMWSLFGNVD